MELAVVKKLREDAKKRGLPIMIICDNERNMYDYAADKFPLIWDDDNQILTSVFINDDYRSTEQRFVVSSVSYSEIQYINTPMSKKELIEWMGEQPYGDEEKKKFIDIVSTYSI